MKPGCAGLVFPFSPFVSLRWSCCCVARRLFPQSIGVTHLTHACSWWKHVAGGPRSAKAMGEPSLKNTPQSKKTRDLLSCFSVPVLSAIYKDITRSTFPQLRPLAKLWWRRAAGCKAVSWTSSVQAPWRCSNGPVFACHFGTEALKPPRSHRAATDGQKSRGSFCRLKQIGSRQG